jgi:PASTA domain-containing protein/List-Bact-rpt repeat protein
MRLRREHRVQPSTAGALRTAMSFGALVLTAAFLLAPTQPAKAGVGADSRTVLGWQELTNPPPFDPGAMFLLTDGTVMVQALEAGPGGAAGSPIWWLLTPDSSGSYVDGTWSQVASLPSDYGPGAYAAAVLPDGRLAVEGGEYNNAIPAESNGGAIYDPLTNAWTMVSPPNGGIGFWANIGDAPSEVLADGRWLVGTAVSADYAILDPTTLTWTTNDGGSRTDGNGEAGYTLLPDGKVLSVDVLPPACTTRTTEAFDPATFLWSSAGTTPTPLVECGDYNEIGPQLMMYDGKVFAEGATPATSLYDVASGTWSSGPSLPVVAGDQQDASDAGSALLPDGEVLLLSRTGAIQVNGGAPSHFFLFDGTSLTQVADNATSARGGLGYMLVLPTGQVLSNAGLGTEGFEIYTDPGSPNPAWAPSITIIPTRLAAGVTYQLVGRQFNGLSDGAAFGDDYQSSTDYPLVQITNDGTGAVAYARTWGMTNRSIAPNAPSCTNFTLPTGIATGPSHLSVIANGIASTAYRVTVGAGGSTQHACPSYTLSLAKAGTGSGTVTSSQAGIDCGATCSHAYPNGTIVTLTATPAVGSALAGWSGGGCSGTGACIATMSSDTPVTATFTLVPEKLTVWKSGDGAGTVTSSPAGIACGTSCSHAYDYGSSVSVKASPAKGSSFAGWDGDCRGKASCVVPMTDARSVTASFVRDCVVPRLKGKSLKTAKRALKAHDCAAGKIKRVFSSTVKKDRVISQKPKPRKRLKHGGKVALTVSRGRKP